MKVKCWFWTQRPNKKRKVPILFNQIKKEINQVQFNIKNAKIVGLS